MPFPLLFVLSLTGVPAVWAFSNPEASKPDPRDKDRGRKGLSAWPAVQGAGAGLAAVPGVPAQPWSHTADSQGDIQNPFVPFRLISGALLPSPSRPPKDLHFAHNGLDTQFINDSLLCVFTKSVLASDS